MNMDYRRLGKRVQERRKKCNLSQEKLAERTNRSPVFIGHIERGTRKMSIETLCEIACALDCSTDELLGMGLSKVDCYASAKELLSLAQMLANRADHDT